DPWRIVLGDVALDARSTPHESWKGDLGDLLDELGSRDMVQVLVEGGAQTAGSFHRANLVDEYWIYVAPTIMGGDDAKSAFAGEGAATMADLHRGEFVSVTKLGADVRLVMRHLDASE
ncbi:MAG: riboflavin biosynthesis protein RibD, partial [Acidimicrobiales bacterium]